MYRMLTGLVLLLAPFSASAAKYAANSVEATDGIIKCFTASDGWFIQSTGPCKTFVAPRRIAIGETFEVGGKKFKIGFIEVSLLDKDIPPTNVTRGFKAGEVSCTAATSRSQAPSGKGDHDGTWMYIDKCRPID
jgi:hypothetical protein